MSENPEFNVEPTAEDCAEVVRRLMAIKHDIAQVTKQLGLPREVLFCFIFVLFF